MTTTDQPNPASPHAACTPVVDARGLACPMPVIELARAVAGLEIGERLDLLATDSTAAVDVPVWCRMQRQRLVDHRQEAGYERFTVERVR